MCFISTLECYLFQGNQGQLTCCRSCKRAHVEICVSWHHITIFSSDILVPFIVGFQSSCLVKIPLNMIRLTTIMVIELTFRTVLLSNGRETPLWQLQRADALCKKSPANTQWCYISHMLIFTGFTTS